MSSLSDQLKYLREYIDYRPPYCSGTIFPADEDYDLFFGKPGDAHRICLKFPSSDALETLSQACDAATFELNNADVLDETYCKAKKLGSADFLLRFDPYSSGLIQAICAELLDEEEEKTPILAEMHKINIYDKGSFFKAPVDTPRAKNIFGSLVVVFPTPHEGGTLILRNSGVEWTIDSAALISEQGQPCIAYIAFYSDVEHEVQVVTSGHRVAATYNLYFDLDDRDLHPSPSLVHPVSSAHAPLKAAFQDLLKEPSFLPDGGTIGFGLRHQYLLEKLTGPEKKNSGQQLQELADRYLKGSDRTIKAVCEELGLAPELGIVYREFSKYTRVQGDIRCDYDIDFGGQEIETPLSSWLGQHYGGRLLNKEAFSEVPAEVVYWVTNIPYVNSVMKTFMAYGNEAELAHTYLRVCLFAKVGPTESRITITSQNA